eukprot:1161759-Pelagomonas_calceolata.AAC.3
MPSDIPGMIDPNQPQEERTNQSQDAFRQQALRMLELEHLQSRMAPMLFCFMRSIRDWTSARFSPDKHKTQKKPCLFSCLTKCKARGPENSSQANCMEEKSEPQKLEAAVDASMNEFTLGTHT